jgi:hypothetical protein
MSIAYGFIPDDFKMENTYSKSPEAIERKRALEMCRTGNVWESSVRAFLLSGVSLQTINLQSDASLDCATLLLPSTAYMEPNLQKNSPTLF